MNSIKCPRCGADVAYNRTNCECGYFIGFPNIRRAQEMVVDLRRNYAAAIADAAARGVDPKVRKLETDLQGTVATINLRRPNIIRNMALGQNYFSYYKALAQDLREIAERAYHAHRSAVDDKVHTGYGTEILNAALSPDGRGLTNYGPITLELREVSIEDRASVMRENSFDFYERNDLGRRDAVEEPGWRSVWKDRAQLGVAHLEPVITPATAESEFVAIILSSGTTRHDDRYMEVHIFGELSWQALKKVTLSQPLTSRDEQDDWLFGRQKLESRDVSVVDAIYP